VKEVNLADINEENLKREATRLNAAHPGKVVGVRCDVTKEEEARNPDLRNAFIEHLEQTKGHLERLKQVAEKLGKRLAGHTCAAMKGLIEEGSEWIGEDAAAEVLDAGIIAAAQRVEHYEMAGNGTGADFCKTAGRERSSRTFYSDIE
jgi:ferritin-like metal-binding protein YciE